ncbi:MAG TPA: helix-turn-helix domain-containing protein [Acidobacteriota bacterium]|jgi:DNA-binding protein Fis
MSRSNLQQRLGALVDEMVSRGIRLDEAERELEAHFLRRVLQDAGGNQCRAAEALGIHRNTLRRKLQRCGLL